MAAFVAMAIGFSLVFNVVGRRGYGESTSINSVAVARSLDPGQYDVTQWTNAFVTGGDTYPIKHAGSGQTYSTAQQLEEVNGWIDNGLDGVFTVDIPLFSSRSFLHRVKAPGPELKLTAELPAGEEDVQQLIIHVEGTLPEDSDFRLLHKDKQYMLALDGNQLKVRQDSHPVRLSAVMQNESYDEWRYSRSVQYPYQAQTPTANNTYSLLASVLLTRMLGILNEDDANSFELPPHRAKVLMYAPLPDTMRLKSEKFGNQNGRVLYVFDLELPTS
jgi:hypothetical protein